MDHLLLEVNHQNTLFSLLTTEIGSSYVMFHNNGQRIVLFLYVLFHFCY